MSYFQNFQHLIPQGKFEMVTDTTSVIAIASPWWLPWLKETSDVSALLLPILGALWLVTQLGWKWYRELKMKQ